MIKINHLLLTLPLLFATSNISAEMYKWVDKEGNISYSDIPPFKGAQELEAPPLNSIPTPVLNKNKPQTDAVQEEEKAEKPTQYSYLKITSPEHDATIRNNQGTFSISFTNKPALDVKQGHYFSVSMDGKTVQNKLQSASAHFSNIDRGSHKIGVKIHDKQGKVLRKSKGITIHLHRFSASRKQVR